MVERAIDVSQSPHVETLGIPVSVFVDQHIVVFSIFKFTAAIETAIPDVVQIGVRKFIADDCAQSGTETAD